MKEGESKMIKKIIYIILTFLIWFGLLNNYTVFALDPDLSSGSAKTQSEFDPNYYTEQINSTESKGTDKISSIGKRIIGLLRGAGTVVSVIVLIAIGIKYMIGSVEEKATYKQTLLPYVIGAVFVFGITTILPIIIEVAKAI